MPCVAIVINSGLVCGKATHSVNNLRCIVHTNSINLHGPHTTDRKEIIAVMRRLMREHEQNRGRMEPEAFLARMNEIYDQYRAQLYDMHRRHNEYIRLHGDPDAPARRARARRRHQDAIRNAQVARLFVAGAVDPFLAGMDAERGERVADINNNIRDFAADRQNVHTEIAVKQTQDIIKKLLEIPVPEEYRWNMTEYSKTPGEIIASCKLSIQSANQMMTRYSMDEKIYEICEGVYGKVLDAVWQFILKSDDKECLMKILKTELTDNIGMCAGGNLTRLANVLAGYVDYIQVSESPVEILGRLMPALMQIADTNERAQELTKALVDSKLPTEKWMEWAEMVFENPVSIQNNRIVCV